MKILMIFFTLTLSTFVLYAQEIVSTLNETKTARSCEVSWTFGEPVIESITGGANIITQGFHQLKLVITKIDQLADLKELVTVFPNPTSRFVTIQFNTIVENTNYSVFDINGKKIDNGVINAKNTLLDFEKFASGSYILKLNYNSNQPLQTFKIVKK